jgi:hypothetical protein
VVADFRVDGGWQPTRAARLGVGLGVRTAAQLAAAGEGRTMGDFDLVVGGAWVAPLKPTPLVGAYFGAAVRSFDDAGEHVVTAVVPLLGAEVALEVPVGKLPIAIAPSFRIQGDLRGTELRTLGADVALAPVETRAGVVVIYRPG